MLAGEIDDAPCRRLAACADVSNRFRTHRTAFGHWVADRGVKILHSSPAYVAKCSTTISVLWSPAMQRTARWAAPWMAGARRVEIEPAAEQLGVSAARAPRSRHSPHSACWFARGGAVSHSVSYDLRCATRRRSTRRGRRRRGRRRAIVPPGGSSDSMAGPPPPGAGVGVAAIQPTPRVVTSKARRSSRWSPTPSASPRAGGAPADQAGAHRWRRALADLRAGRSAGAAGDRAAHPRRGDPGVDDHGRRRCRYRNEMEAAVNQAMLMRANQAVVVADHQARPAGVRAGFAPPPTSTWWSPARRQPTEVAALRRWRPRHPRRSLTSRIDWPTAAPPEVGAVGGRRGWCRCARRAFRRVRRPR